MKEIRRNIVRNMLTAPHALIFFLPPNGNPACFG
jgi:hypothetical protein